MLTPWHVGTRTFGRSFKRLCPPKTLCFAKNNLGYPIVAKDPPEEKTPEPPGSTGARDRISEDDAHRHAKDDYAQQVEDTATAPKLHWRLSAIMQILRPNEGAILFLLTYSKSHCGNKSCARPNNDRNTFCCTK